MKIKKLFFCVLVIILLAGIINVDVANVTAANPAGNEPWTTEYVDLYSGADVGRYVSIAHHPKTGAAYISYYDAVNGNLWMAHEVTPGTGDCPGNNDWICVLVDETGDVGQYSSIDVVYERVGSTSIYVTNVGIAYYDATNRSLKYASYLSNPINTWTFFTVDAAPPTPGVVRGTHTSMKFNKDGVPVIGYHVLTLLPSYGAVKVAKLVSSGGTGCGGGSPSWTCQTIEGLMNYNDHGSHVSIDFDSNNKLYVAFFNAANNSLSYAWEVDNGGSCHNNSEWDCVMIDQGPGRGKFISMHAKNSPAEPMRFTYYDENEGKIRYAEWVGGTNGNCLNKAFDCYAVDTVGTTIGNYGLSMDVDLQGYPIIAYMDVSEDTAPAMLKIARPAPAYGVPHGNCGDVPPGDLFQYWTCKTIDGGSYYSDEAEFVGVSVNPAGLATVAYSEYNHYYLDRFRLKVAKQHFETYLPLIKK
jgi:hypothetical protein